MIDGGRFFQLGENRGAARDQRSQFRQIFGALNERRCHPVDPDFETESEVAVVFLRKRRQRQHHVGHVNAFAIR